MGGMDEMMEAMIGSMSKEDKQAMMAKMMEKFFAGMTAEDKQRMMEQMMPKMMEGINMAEMMPRMMMGMMGHGGKPRPKAPGSAARDGWSPPGRASDDGSHDDADDAGLRGHDAAGHAEGRAHRIRAGHDLQVDGEGHRRDVGRREEQPGGQSARAHNVSLTS